MRLRAGLLDAHAHAAGKTKRPGRLGAECSRGDFFLTTLAGHLPDLKDRSIFLRPAGHALTASVEKQRTGSPPRQGIYGVCLEATPPTLGGLSPKSRELLQSAGASPSSQGICGAHPKRDIHLDGMSSALPLAHKQNPSTHF